MLTFTVIVLLLLSHGHCQATNSRPDTSLQDLVHQQQVILDTLKSITTEFNVLKNSITNEMTVMRTSIDDLKTSMDDLKNATDCMKSSADDSKVCKTNCH